MGDPLSLAEHGHGLALVELFAPGRRVHGGETDRTVTACVPPLHTEARRAG